MPRMTIRNIAADYHHLRSAYPEAHLRQSCNQSTRRAALSGAPWTPLPNLLRLGYLALGAFDADRPLAWLARQVHADAPAPTRRSASCRSGEWRIWIALPSWNA